MQCNFILHWWFLHVVTHRIKVEWEIADARAYKGGRKPTWYLLSACANLSRGPVANHQLVFTPATTMYNIDRLWQTVEMLLPVDCWIFYDHSPWHPMTIWHSTCRSIQRICEPRRFRVRVVWDAWDGMKHQTVSIHFHWWNLGRQSMSTNTDDYMSWSLLPFG